jgi:2-oxoglutarate ferredoxin oxidoreductase subunit gamma
LHDFDTAIILNQQSLDKFEKSVKPGGVLIYDPNGLVRHPERKDIKIYRVEATDEATKMQSAKTFNMIVLGAYLKIKPIVKMDNVTKGLEKVLPERHHHLIPMNIEAIKRGQEIVKEYHAS